MNRDRMSRDSKKWAITGMGWVGGRGLGRARDSQSPGWASGGPAPFKLSQVISRTEGRSGRLDEFSKLGLASAALALTDAGLDRWTAKRPIGVIASSVYGCIGTDDAYFNTVLPDEGKLSSPNLFAYTLPNCFVGETALRYGLTGPTLVINPADTTNISPLVIGLETLASGEAQALLCGFCDLEPPATIAPLDRVETGSVFMLLEPPGREDITPLATLALDGAEVTNEGEKIDDFYAFIDHLIHTLERDAR